MMGMICIVYSNGIGLAVYLSTNKLCHDFAIYPKALDICTNYSKKEKHNFNVILLYKTEGQL